MKYQPKIVTAFFKQQGLSEPIYELQYIPGRKFRLDVAWPNDHVKDCNIYCGGIGLEVQGGIFIRGAHSTGTGIKRDMEKRNLGILNGWRILEVEPKDLCTMDTVMMVKKLMELK